MVGAVCIVPLCPVNVLLEGSRDCPVSRNSYLCSQNLLTLQLSVYLTLAVSLSIEMHLLDFRVGRGTKNL